MAEIIAIVVLALMLAGREWGTYKAHGRLLAEMRLRDQETARERAELLERIQRPEMRPASQRVHPVHKENAMRPEIARDYARIGAVMAPLPEDTSA